MFQIFLALFVAALQIFFLSTLICRLFACIPYWLQRGNMSMWKRAKASIFQRVNVERCAPTNIERMKGGKKENKKTRKQNGIQATKFARTKTTCFAWLLCAFVGLLFVCFLVFLKSRNYPFTQFLQSLGVHFSRSVMGWQSCWHMGARRFIS